MLRRKMGGGKAPRKMAKKAVPAALQTEVTNNEEWSKILEKDGLIVVDVYSEWSGPCTGMVSILKKIKMEVGGDTLSYATAKCDYITDLRRFEGKSEPTWMFIHNGRMVNLIFGANCPELFKTLTTELGRFQNGESHELSLAVSEKSPIEEERLRVKEEIRIAKETAKRIQKEIEAKERYESEMEHFISSLYNETCLLIYPWVFKDQEGRRRDKKSSPPYVELVEEILPGNYTVEQEIRKQLDDSMLEKLLGECDFTFNEEDKQLLFDGKCMFMRLKVDEKRPDIDVHGYLLNILFEQSTFPNTETLAEGCFAQRHKPAFVTPEGEGQVFPIVWMPVNSRNKVIVFQTIFRCYLVETYPYESKSGKAPLILFKFDNTRKNELKKILNLLEDEVTNFGVFEYDKPPEAKLLGTCMEEFEKNVTNATGYEIFVCTIEKIGSTAFIKLAGIGPYHVSENSAKAIEETKLYFPNAIPPDDAQSDDDDKSQKKSQINEYEADTTD